MSHRIRIKNVGTSDFDDIRQILREAWAQSYAGLGLLESMYKLLEDASLTFLLPRAGETAVMALSEGQPAGILVARRFHDVSRILGLYIRPRFQRQGLGKALISHVTQHFPEHTVLEAQVMETSTVARAFYHTLGFVAVGRLWMPLSNAQVACVIAMRLRDPLIFASAPNY